MLFYQSDNFPFPVLKLDTRGNPRSVIFWSAVFHSSFVSPYSYNEFIDLFTQQPPCWEGFPLPGSVVILKIPFNFPSNANWETGIYTRTSQNSKYMVVSFPPLSYLSMFQCNCLHWNTIGKCVMQIWSILQKPTRKHS